MDVLIAGAGPTGLTLAHELARAGVDVTVVERLTTRLEQMKGGTIQPRTAELLDQRGLLDPMLARALPRNVEGGHFGLLPVPLDARPWHTRYPVPISVPQWMVEEELERAAGVPVLRGHEVTAVEQDEDGVTVTANGRRLRARYLVACDGAHSTVRKLLGVPFPGRPGTYRAVLTDIRLASASDLVPKEAGHISKLTREGGGYWGMLVPIGELKYRFTFGRKGDTAEDEVQQALTAIYGDQTRLAEVLTSSRFSDSTRQLEQYRHGRVLFAGDAAHIHPPLGGQGLNLGVQDALNLGWKLAAKLAGRVDLLDTYQDERHPPAARVLHHTAAQRVLANPNPDPDVLALREIFTDLLRLPDTNRHLAGMMSGLDAPGRVPDLDLVTADGPVRLAELLRSGRGLLLDFGEHDWPEGWADRVDVVRVKGESDADAMLLRPDGVVCWSGDGAVTDALTRWFGHAV
ncbi:2-polyprenyl-6-methoxyphenol hydroxylase-like FAD-dependent oxidoreductase [Amycolatopsis bartoniae]|uniref:FAD-dependent oxidoreductase n=1 Tax=Amycolatopsis bartoniae TaxID=941986 RepID=A0A8H9IV18_9PSEU|nr:FAD-dependent monooxygenase [Amycolatopsis bartoniae]MBB2934989.1 2-polyprenyl-6-methoxyphenol hydroxylase-like FAD-dependent oxidoreductase [Amycolatopsis bartoniae]TVT01970.1 FAD-binding protein [Amycolatopsis bartoniae]GHF43274.1 FAD-dependent oxidoreductase [Amycolatopsis bartoniae]